MEVINPKDLDGIYRKHEFYDFDKMECRTGQQYIVEFIEKDDITTFSHIQYGGKEESFAYYKKAITSFLFQLIEEIEDPKCIILKYNDKWVVDQSESKVLASLLAGQGVMNEDNKGIKVDKDDLIVELFVDSVLTYNSFVCFLFEQSKIVVAPTDHLDIFIAAKDSEKLNKQINEMIADREHNTLSYRTIR